ncbi:MAG: electron transport complex subunit RsxG [Gammaproteobacteria bacterium]|jgi:electron transport complex protein RnfG
MNYRQILITAFILLVFALIGTALVAYTFEGTHERIVANERAALLQKLHSVLPPERYDNALLEDTLQVRNRKLLGTVQPVTVYRARREGRPVAVVIAPVAPDGYSGTIRLLVGINVDGTLSGVRVVSHRETPGLGDAIDEERSGWIHLFDGKSLGNPPLEKWQVRKDGGEFDQFTGATITPRAVVKAVRNALLYYRENRVTLFENAQDRPRTAANHNPPNAGAR